MLAKYMETENTAARGHSAEEALNMAERWGKPCACGLYPSAVLSEDREERRSFWSTRRRERALLSGTRVAVEICARPRGRDPNTAEIVHSAQETLEMAEHRGRLLCACGLHLPIVLSK